MERGRVGEPEQERDLAVGKRPAKLVVNADLRAVVLYHEPTKWVARLTFGDL